MIGCAFFRIPNKTHPIIFPCLAFGFLSWIWPFWRDEIDKCQARNAIKRGTVSALEDRNGHDFFSHCQRQLQGLTEENAFKKEQAGQLLRTAMTPQRRRVNHSIFRSEVCDVRPQLTGFQNSLPLPTCPASAGLLQLRV